MTPITVKSFPFSYYKDVMLGRQIINFSKTNKTEVNPMKAPIRGLFLTLMAFALLFSVACDYAATTAPEAAKASAPTGEARSLADVNFLKWSPATWKQMTSLNASTVAAKTITVSAGGEVGGNKTFGNTVEIPAGAIDDNTKISVEVTCMDDQNPCSAEVEFLPSMTFNVDVKVTMHYGALGFDGDPYMIEIYWIQEDGTGGEVNNYVVDESNQIIVFYVNHFTRYGWAY